MRRRSLFKPIAAVALFGLAAAGTTMTIAHHAGAASTLAATAGCGKAATLASGTHSITSSGQSRSYILRVPDNYDSSHPYRLIFAFHWNGGTANDVDSGGTSGYPWSYYGIRALSNNSAIFVAPQGISNGWANSGGQDLTFVDNMISQIEAGLCVDTTQLFSMGFSYGGAMTYAIACARATVFRAVAVYSGANLSGCSGGTQPIAYIGIHGLRDNVLPIALGRALRDTFVKNNGCTPQNPPEPAANSLTHIVTYYSGCKAGYPVAWAAFDGPHAPNAVDGTADAYAPGENSWTRPVVWSFFTQFDTTTTPTTTPATPTTTPASPTTTSATPTTTPATPTTSPASPTTTPASPTTTPTVTTSSCRVTDTVNAWNTGLTQNITIANTGTTAINGWSLVFTLPSGQTITSGWNATYSPSSGKVTATNVSYNAAIAPNASVSIGFQATHTGNAAAPTSFTLNGAACTVA